MTSIADAHLEIDPEDVIEFVLDPAVQSSAPPSTQTTTNHHTNKVTLTLTNPDVDGVPIVFKVKTTQPRRYLVRPNQGLIMPGKSEVVQIVLVDKDRQELIRSYNTMGHIAFEQCNKDKFLLQSVAVSHMDANQLTSYDAITGFWSSGTNTSGVANKKIHVRHTVAADTMTSGSSNDTNGVTPTTKNSRSTIGIAGNYNKPAGSSSSSSAQQSLLQKQQLQQQQQQQQLVVSEMSKEQLIVEVIKVRAKYDELIAFSVNLTAERDLISNALEVSKRDLQRLIKDTGYSGNNNNINNNHRGGGLSKRGIGSATTITTTTKKSTVSNIVLCIGLILISLFIGMYVQEHHRHTMIQPYIQKIREYYTTTITTGTIGSTTGTTTATMTATDDTMTTTTSEEL